MHGFSVDQNDQSWIRYDDSAVGPMKRKILIDNMWQTRWVVADDFVPWVLWEPSKGKKGMTWKTLFDKDHGNCQSMMFGTCYVPPGCRYSRHTHAQPEIYYCFSGGGEIFVGDSTVDVKAGTAVYVPRGVVHGAQNKASIPMQMVWVYGTESTNDDWSWTPAEDIYLEAQNK